MNPFVAHLVGDFILQNEWMAVNKKDRSFACMVHVLVYLIPFLFCQLQWWQILLIGIQHFIQDRTEFVLWWMHKWKRINSGEGRGIALFVDQAFHIVWIEFVILMGAGSVSFLPF
jgi:hypothetical protein